MFQGGSGGFDPSMMIVTVFGFFLGLVLISLLAAICLRLAAKLLQMPEIPFGLAYKVVFISWLMMVGADLVMTVTPASLVQLSVISNMNMNMNQYGQNGSQAILLSQVMGQPLILGLSKLFQFYVTALLIARLIPDHEERRMEFKDALVLTMTYLGITAISIAIMVSSLVFFFVTVVRWFV